MQQTHNYKSWLAALWLALLLPALTLADDGYDHLIVFGDSLSDPGNAYRLNGIALTPPYETLDALLIPDGPYATGGHHFSNGSTWIEQFARSQGLRASARPAYALGHGHNYAVGGARARSSGRGIDFADQVGLFLSQDALPREGRTLTVVQFGGNDVRDAIAALAVDSSGSLSASILGEALTAMADNILTLYAAGARELLIANSPDLSLTPAIHRLDLVAPGSGLAASMISLQYNSGLDGLIAQLQSQLPGLSIVKLDIYAALNDMVANPERYRLNNVTEACITPNIPPYSCTDTKGTLFWDGIHPTKHGHAIVALFTKELFSTEEESEKVRHSTHQRPSTKRTERNHAH